MYRNRFELKRKWCTQSHKKILKQFITDITVITPYLQTASKIIKILIFKYIRTTISLIKNPKLLNRT